MKIIVTYTGTKGERQINGAFPLNMPTDSAFAALKKGVTALRQLSIQPTKMKLQQWPR